MRSGIKYMVSDKIPYKMTCLVGDKMPNRITFSVGNKIFTEMRCL